MLLILVDSLRADMPWAGYPRDIAPRLDAFRRERCVTYLNGYSLSSYTAKSVAPALVGDYPSSMPRDGLFFTRYEDRSNVYLSELAQTEGHRTLAGLAHGYFLPVFGMNQGFDDYRMLPGGVDLASVRSITSEALTKLATSMLSDHKNTHPPDGRRFFAYFHYMDPHFPYERHPAHSRFGWKQRDLYDGEVHLTDFWLGKLLDFAREQPWWSETAVILTADHGEGFGERGHYRHAYELWESVIRVPWLVCVPGTEPRVIAARRSHIDLAPTIHDLMRIAAKRRFLGTSLLPELFGANRPPRRIVADLPRCDLMDRRRAVIDGDWKIVASGDDKSFLLFDLAADALEKHDLASRRPAELERMKRVYFEESAKIPLVEVAPGVPLRGAPQGRRW